MGELAKRQDYEKRAKEYLRENQSQRKFLYKEFSRPVRSANYLANRQMLDIITRASKFNKNNLFKYDRELDLIHQLEKTLTIKSIDFDGYEFHRVHEERRRFPNVKVPTVNEILRKVPSNAVLDFGSGNKVIERVGLGPNGMRTKRTKLGYSSDFFSHHSKRSTGKDNTGEKKSVKSRYAKYFRSQSVIPPSFKENISLERIRPSTSKPCFSPRGHVVEKEYSPRGQSLTALSIRIPSPCRPQSSRSSGVNSNLDNEDSEGDDVTDFNICEDEYKSKSYRTLKEMYTYKEEDEAPVIDKKAETLKKMKTREKNIYKHLDRRVKAFIKQK